MINLSARKALPKILYAKLLEMQRKESRSFFVYGFLKSEQDNIDKNDEKDFKKLAKILLAASDKDLSKLIKQKKFFEVPYHE